MTPKEFIAKGLLWSYIKVKGLHRILGGVGHNLHTCGLAPWKLPDPGPWMGVCSPRIYVLNMMNA